MSQKRKRPESEDSDDDEPFLGKQVLPVANLPTEFSGIPQDGMEYLWMVRRDARSLPHITRVHNPYEIDAKPTPDIPEGLKLSNTRSVLPGEQWRETFLRRFRNFKKNCSQPTIHVDTPVPSRKLHPEKKDRDAWWAYLRGCPESEWNPPKKLKGRKQQSYGMGMRAFGDERIDLQFGEIRRFLNSGETSHADEEREVEQVITYNPAESLPTPSGTPAPPERSHVNIGAGGASTSTSFVQPEPTPTLMRQTDHCYSLHLLMYFAHWINLYLEHPLPRTCTITETHARWMFVLLSQVDDYITADEQSTLRGLARGCMNLIKERLQCADQEVSVGPNDAVSIIGIPSCWMIITAVIGLWGQRDLWVDAEALLSSGLQ